METIAPFIGEGRGPELQSWLHDADLLFPDHHVGFAPPPGNIVGAQVAGGWVVLHGLQVAQIVPEEVHSYWHSRIEAGGPEQRCSIWRIDESEWIRGFNPRHLWSCHHFVLEFYDELVEAVAEELIFGEGDFSLEEAIRGHGSLGYAYLRRAISLSNEGRREEAEASFVAYLETDPDESERGYATRCLEELRKRP